MANCQKNCYTKSAEKFHLHHFSLNFDLEAKRKSLEGIRFVLIAGCSRRAENLAIHLSNNCFNGEISEEKLTREFSRFDLFRVGPVLVANHGMGSPSMSIAVHELCLLCKELGLLKKVVLLRFGTCKYLSRRSIYFCY